MKIQEKTYTVIYTVAVGLVVFGLCFRFGGEKYIIDYYRNKYNDSPTKTVLNACKYFGVALYVFGWLIVSVCLSLKHKGNRILKNSILSVALVSVLWAVFEFKEEGFVFQPKLPLISCSVLLSALVALISLKYSLKDIVLIVVASFLIVFSEYAVLPFQRENNIVDGLGIPLLILGWFILFYVFNGDSEPFSKVFNVEEGIPLRVLR
jgi:hypothetical protein